MPVTNDKKFVYLNETSVTAGANWSTIQEGQTKDKSDPTNTDAAIIVDEEVARLRLNDQGSVNLAAHGNVGFDLGDYTFKYQEPSGLTSNSVNDPAGNAVSSYVSKTDTVSSSRITFGGDVGVDFRWGNNGLWVLNPYLGYRRDQYLGTSKAAVADFAGATVVDSGNYFTFGARGSVRFSDHVGLTVGYEHGLGGVNATLYDSNGEVAAGSHGAAASYNMLTGGLTIEIANPESARNAAARKATANEDAAKQEIHDHIMSEVGDMLKACGYSDVTVNVYSTPNFDGTTLTPLPGVPGKYYNIEALITGTDGTAESVGAESTADMSEHTTHFSSADEFIAAVKAGHAALAPAKPEEKPAADKPTGQK